MRGFLIFLACAVPVVLLSPFFWSLVNMNFGAERIGYGHKTADGGMVTQWATLGPKAPWPKWAIIPAGTELTVGANFEAAPAPGLNATGYGDIDGRIPARSVTEQYSRALQQGGWSVRTGRFDAMSPDIPPHPIHTCIVEGRKGAQVQRLSVAIDDARTAGSLWWTVGEAKFPLGTSDQPCWR
jgi:hypothetical protein